MEPVDSSLLRYVVVMVSHICSVVSGTSIFLLLCVFGPGNAAAGFVDGIESTVEEFLSGYGDALNAINCSDYSDTMACGEDVQGQRDALAEYSKVANSSITCLKQNPLYPFESYGVKGSRIRALQRIDRPDIAGNVDEAQGGKCDHLFSPYLKSYSCLRPEEYLHVPLQPVSLSPDQEDLTTDIANLQLAQDAVDQTQNLADAFFECGGAVTGDACSALVNGLKIGFTIAIIAVKVVR